LNKRNQALLDLLNNQPGRSSSDICNSWRNFAFTINFLNKEEIHECEEALSEFLRKRMSSKPNLYWMLLCSSITVPKNKLSLIKPIINDTINKMPPGKFIYLFEEYQNLIVPKEKNIFGYNFMEPIIINADNRIKKILMNYKLSSTQKS